MALALVIGAAEVVLYARHWRRTEARRQAQTRRRSLTKRRPRRSADGLPGPPPPRGVRRG